MGVKYLLLRNEGSVMKGKRERKTTKQKRERLEYYRKNLGKRGERKERKNQEKNEQKTARYSTARCKCIKPPRACPVASSRISFFLLLHLEVMMADGNALKSVRNMKKKFTKGNKSHAEAGVESKSNMDRGGAKNI